MEDEAPLWKAVCHNNEKVMMSLLNQGVNTEWSGGNILTDKTTALQMAVRMGRHSMVDMLLEYQANIHVRSHDGGTLLHEAVKWLESWKAMLMVRMLVKNGVDVMLETLDGQTALEIVSAVDTTELSAQRIRFITKTRENLKSEMDRLKQAKQCLVAFAMGQHKRLGQFSKVLTLHPELVRMIL